MKALRLVTVLGAFLIFGAHAQDQVAPRPATEGASSSGGFGDFITKLKDHIKVVGSLGTNGASPARPLINSGQHQTVHSAADAAKWDILGVHLGQDYASVGATVRKTYPRAKQLESKIRIVYRSFTAPEAIYGSQFVAGYASTYGNGVRPLAGDRELGVEEEHLDVEYVYPSSGRVVAILRSHVYGAFNSACQLNSGDLPTLETLKSALFTKYGTPDYANIQEAGYDAYIAPGRAPATFGISTCQNAGSSANWEWSTVAPEDRHQSCLDEVELRRFSSGEGLGLPAAEKGCGIRLTVRVVYFRVGSASSVLRVETSLIDNDAAADAIAGLSKFLEAGGKQATDSDQKDRSAIKPAL